MMHLNEYQAAQQDIYRRLIDQACERHPQHAAAIRSHDWLIDMSDMVVDCARSCGAVLHAGEKRFARCPRAPKER